MNWMDFIAPFEDAEKVPDDYLWDRYRIWRDKELVASDWTQVADAPTDKAAWAAYRKQLRDLPSSASDPKKIVFPTRPA